MQQQGSEAWFVGPVHGRGGRVGPHNDGQVWLSTFLILAAARVAGTWRPTSTLSRPTVDRKTRTSLVKRTNLSMPAQIEPGRNSLNNRSVIYSWCHEIIFSNTIRQPNPHRCTAVEPLYVRDVPSRLVPVPPAALCRDCDPRAAPSSKRHSLV